ncbi:hypothetical protein KAW18_02630 [candidate division WOR-3 bacterium]|nr:hypothetical protein [candidate division WOR-3 bacterium]
MEINKRAWIACIIVVLFVFMLSWGGGYPTESKNMHTACDWCEEEGTRLYEYCPLCGYSAACDVCVRYYREHFNLTVDEFPHYCHRNEDSGSPTKIEWWFMRGR